MHAQASIYLDILLDTQFSQPFIKYSQLKQLNFSKCTAFISYNSAFQSTAARLTSAFPYALN
jgi:hypothetical protein